MARCAGACGRRRVQRATAACVPDRGAPGLPGRGRAPFALGLRLLAQNLLGLSPELLHLVEVVVHLCRERLVHGGFRRQAVERRHARNRPLPRCRDLLVLDKLRGLGLKFACAAVGGDRL